MATQTDHPRQGPQHGAAQGDGGRPQGPAHGRGRRQARRRLPDHRRPAEGLRRGPRHRQPARGVRHRRHRGRHGAARLPPRRGDPVRRLRLPGYDQIVCQVAKMCYRSKGAPRCRWSSGSRSVAASVRSSTTASPPRRSSRTRPASRSWPARTRGRLLDDPAGDRVRRPGDLPRAQAAVPRRQGRARRERDPRAAVHVARGEAGHRRHRAVVRPDGEDRAEGRRGRRRRGQVARGHRPAHARRWTWVRCSSRRAVPAGWS